MFWFPGNSLSTAACLGTDLGTSLNLTSPAAEMNVAVGATFLPDALFVCFIASVALSLNCKHGILWEGSINLLKNSNRLLHSLLQPPLNCTINLIMACGDLIFNGQTGREKKKNDKKHILILKTLPEWINTKHPQAEFNN